MTGAPITCPGCGEERLVDIDEAAHAWFCQVCGQSGVGPGGPAGPAGRAATVPLVVPEPLQQLLLAVVARYLAPGESWQIIAAAPLAQWPRALQRELTATLGALSDTVVLVLERTPQ